TRLQPDSQDNLALGLARCVGSRRYWLCHRPYHQSGARSCFRQVSHPSDAMGDEPRSPDLVAHRGPHGAEKALPGLPPRLDRHGRVTPPMCFSAAASFSAAGLLGLTGIATLAQVRNRAELPLAFTPLLFAAQQAVEGALWLTVPQGRDHSLTLANI